MKPKNMKRYGNIYDKICDMDNLRLAHQNAREDKLFYKEVKMVDSWRLFEKYIEPIVNALVAYYKFVIKKDTKPKARNNAVIKYVNKIYQKKGRVAT